MNIQYTENKTQLPSKLLEINKILAEYAPSNEMPGLLQERWDWVYTILCWLGKLIIQNINPWLKSV